MVHGTGGAVVGNSAQELFNSLEFVADLHCDALLWNRDLTRKSDYGHVDFPRMQEGKVLITLLLLQSDNDSQFLPGLT